MMQWLFSQLHMSFEINCRLMVCLKFMVYLKLKAKDALRGLTKEKNGVDGSSIYM